MSIHIAEALSILDALAASALQDPAVYAGGKYQERAQGVSDAKAAMSRWLLDERVVPNPHYQQSNQMVALSLLLAFKHPDEYLRLFSPLNFDPVDSWSGFMQLWLFLGALMDDHDYAVHLMPSGPEIVLQGSTEPVKGLYPMRLVRVLRWRLGLEPGVSNEDI